MTFTNKRALVKRARISENLPSVGYTKYNTRLPLLRAHIYLTAPGTLPNLARFANPPCLPDGLAEIDDDVVVADGVAVVVVDVDVGVVDEHGEVVGDG